MVRIVRELRQLARLSVVGWVYRCVPPLFGGIGARREVHDRDRDEDRHGCEPQVGSMHVTTYRVRPRETSASRLELAVLEDPIGALRSTASGCRAQGIGCFMFGSILVWH